MNFHENPYYKLSRKLLLLVGQWPYDDSNMRHLARLLVCLPLAMLSVSEVYDFTQWDGKFEELIRMLPFYCFTVIIFVKYFTCWIKIKLIRDSLDYIKCDWNTLQSEIEVEIMKKQTARGWLLGKFYVTLTFSTAAFIVLVMFLPPILDVVVPLNESRTQNVLSQAGFLINLQEYYFYVVFQCQCMAVIGVVTITAADVSYIMIINHACGMYDVVGYRLEHIFDGIERISKDQQEIVFRKRIINVVQSHLRMLEFGRINMSCYVNSYVIQFFMTVLSIAGLLANINHSLIMGNKALVCAFTMDVISHYFVVFINITPCQRVKDQSTDLFHNMCGGCWYEAPLPSQKLLLFMMRKLQQPFIPSAAGIFDMTYETFSKIVQVSFSYFIIMTSMQEDVL